MKVRTRNLARDIHRTLLSKDCIKYVKSSFISYNVSPKIQGPWLNQWSQKMESPDERCKIKEFEMLSSKENGRRKERENQIKVENKKGFTNEDQNGRETTQSISGLTLSGVTWWRRPVRYRK